MLLSWAKSTTFRITSGKPTSRYRSGALPRSGFVGTNVIPLSDSANLDAVVAHTRGDETVREAVSVFIDHAKTLIEQGGPNGVIMCAAKRSFGGS